MAADGAIVALLMRCDPLPGGRWQRTDGQPLTKAERMLIAAVGPAELAVMHRRYVEAIAICDRALADNGLDDDDAPPDALYGPVRP